MFDQYDPHGRSGSGSGSGGSSRVLTPVSDMAEWEELKRKVRTLESRLEVRTQCGRVRV